MSHQILVGGGHYVLDAMVSWQRFVAIAFDVAKTKGASFDGIEDGGDFMQSLSALWSMEKDRIKQLTEEQARNYLLKRVEK